MRGENREVEGTRDRGKLRRGKGTTVELGRELNTNGGWARRVVAWSLLC